jgi:hypothetical protein
MSIFKLAGTLSNDAASLEREAQSVSFSLQHRKENRAMTAYLDLSQFHLCLQEEDKPYWIFDPKSDVEYEQLEEFLHIDEIAAKLVTEGEAHLEQAGGGLEPGEQADWSRIYKVTLSDSETDAEIKTEKGETIYVLIVVMVKDGKFTKFWAAFLCSKKNSKYLFADQAAYHDIVREVLEASHTPPLHGPN